MEKNLVIDRHNSKCYQIEFEFTNGVCILIIPYTISSKEATEIKKVIDEIKDNKNKE